MPSQTTEPPAQSSIRNGKSLNFQVFPQTARTIRWIDILYVFGMLTIPFQFVQIGMAQPGHIWMLFALGIIVIYGAVGVTALEAIVFAGFIFAAICLTIYQDYERIKSGEQIFKFLIIYPGFYIVGRGLGELYITKDTPIGYKFLFIFLLFQFIVQALAIPYIFEELPFGLSSLHGTFKERNWLAMYFFLFSYFLFLKAKDNKAFLPFLPFFLLNGIVMVLSGSKTIIVACGIVFLLKARIPVILKLAGLIAVATFYLYVFGEDFSSENINVRLEEERGLAFQESIPLLLQNPIGHGFGFVEGYFANLPILIRGLGEGTNSVFSVPLDLAIIAGAGGLIFWSVFFLGVGLRAVGILAPIAALSLLNPLHQSEFVYLFLGMLVSRALSAPEVSPRIFRKRKLLLPSLAAPFGRKNQQ